MDDDGDDRNGSGSIRSCASDEKARRRGPQRAAASQVCVDHDWQAERAEEEANLEDDEARLDWTCPLSNTPARRTNGKSKSIRSKPSASTWTMARLLELETSLWLDCCKV